MAVRPTRVAQIRNQVSKNSVATSGNDSAHSGISDLSDIIWGDAAGFDATALICEARCQPDGQEAPPPGPAGGERTKGGPETTFTSAALNEC